MFTGTVAWLGGSVDANSHMVDVYLTAPADAALRVGELIRGRLQRRSSGHVIVPRAAVLPGDDGQSVFVIEGGKARRRVVTVGLQNGQSVEITSDAVKPGDQVVTLGNYELEDGMAVRTTPSNPAGQAPGNAEAPK